MIKNYLFLLLIGCTSAQSDNLSVADKMLITPVEAYKMCVSEMVVKDCDGLTQKECFIWGYMEASYCMVMKFEQK